MTTSDDKKPQLEITHKAYNRADVFTVAGRIDSSNASEFGKAMMEKIEEGRANIVVNMAGITFFSSAGIRELIAAQQAAQKRPLNPGKIIISGASDFIKEVLTITALNNLFTLADTDLDAVGAF